MSDTTNEADQHNDDPRFRTRVPKVITHPAPAASAGGPGATITPTLAPAEAKQFTRTAEILQRMVEGINYTMKSLVERVNSMEGRVNDAADTLKRIEGRVNDTLGRIQGLAHSADFNGLARVEHVEGLRRDIASSTEGLTKVLADNTEGLAEAKDVASLRKDLASALAPIGKAAEDLSKAAAAMGKKSKTEHE